MELTAVSMREAFREHHKLTDDEQKRLWESCLFVLDTNVLLNIYRYADVTRDDLFRVLRYLGPRVWVPFQAAREFYKDRLAVIRKQRSKYKELSEVVSSQLSRVGQGDFKKSGFLKIDELQEILRPAVERAVGLIEQEERAHPDLLSHDPYLETLVDLIGDSIGNEPSSEQDAREATEAQDRIDRKQPPGYEDAKKPVPERYGDVFIWFEILRLAESQHRPIMFVTDENSEDWWQVVEGKKLGPRPELRAEMRRQASVDFGICSPARLLEVIGEQLPESVDPTSVEDARKIAEELRRSQYGGHWISASNFEMRAELAVEKWLQGRHPDASFSRQRGSVAAFIMHQGPSRTPVEIVAIRSIELVPVLERKLLEFASRRSPEQLLVLVGVLERVAEKTRDAVSGLVLPNTHPPIVLGYLEDGVLFYHLTDL